MAQKLTQTTLDGLHATQPIDWEHTRATGREITFYHDFDDNDDIDEAYLTIRDSDDTAVVQLTLADHASQWDFTVDGYCEILLDDDDTRDLTVGVYNYGVKFIGTDGVEQTPVVGTITLTDEVVYDDGTAAYLTWNTRSDFETLQNALLLCNEGTTLASDAAAAAGSIVVTSAAPFTAGDTIYIEDGTNSESHDIAAGGISGTTITLDATTLSNSYTAEVTVVVKEF